MPQPQVLLGHYTSDGTARLLESPVFRVDANVRIELYNRTNFASTANPGVVKRAWWQTGMPAGSWRGVQNTDAAATDESTGAATNGFTLIDTNQTLQLEAAQTSTGAATITAADPAVVSQTAHGYEVGDIVRLTNTTDMLQIAGYDFEITAVTANTYTLGYLDASGFAAAATAVTSQRLRYENIFTPRKRLITNITQAAQAVVTFSVTHEYQVGQRIVFHGMADHGMVEIDELKGEVVAVDLANNTATVDIDSTGFTAFAFPTSAEASTGTQWAHTTTDGVEDVGLLDVATQNRGFGAMLIGTDVVGADTDIVDYKILSGF